MCIKISVMSIIRDFGSKPRRWVAPLLLVVAGLGLAAASAATLPANPQQGSGDAVTALTAQIGEEAGLASIAGGACWTATPIADPGGTLPGQVYVLAGGDITLEFPQDRMTPVPAQDCVANPCRQSSSDCTVAVTATVLPSRLLLVDEDDLITGIWSNASGSEYGFYCLRVQSVEGEAHPLTQEILAQYNRLLGCVDWNVSGQVWAVMQGD